MKAKILKLLMIYQNGIFYYFFKNYKQLVNSLGRKRMVQNLSSYLLSDATASVYYFILLFYSDILSNNGHTNFTLLRYQLQKGLNINELREHVVVKLCVKITRERDQRSLLSLLSSLSLRTLPLMIHSKPLPELLTMPSCLY